MSKTEIKIFLKNFVHNPQALAIKDIPYEKKIQKTLVLVFEASNKMAPIFRPITFEPLSWTQTSPLVAIKLPSEVHLQFQKVKKKLYYMVNYVNLYWFLSCCF